MTYTKLDDNFDTNPKLIRAIGRAGDSAGWMWVRAVNYCNRHLTDGFVPGEIASSFTRHRKPAEVIAALVDVGAWGVVDGGYEVHDFLDWNDSREKVLAARAATKERKDAWLERRRNESGTRPETRSERVQNGNGTRPERPPLHSTPLLSSPDPTDPGSRDGADAPPKAKRVRKAKDPDAEPSGHKVTVDFYAAEFERVRGVKPAFGGREGKAVKTLLEVVGGDVARAQMAIRNALTVGAWPANATILDVAKDPSRYLTATSSPGTHRKGIQPAAPPGQEAWTAATGDEFWEDFDARTDEEPCPTE